MRKINKTIWLPIFQIIFFICLNLAFNASPIAAGASNVIEKPLIVLDPGHSPKNQGAKSCAGKSEYLYNDSLVNKIYQTLRKKNIPVALTRTPGQDISLANRAKMADGKKFFLSVHHDSVQPQYLTYVDGNPQSDYASGYSIFVSKKNSNFAKSLEYAKILGRELQAAGLKYTPHHAEKIKGENRVLLDPELGIYQYDDLIVLKNSKAPAALLEAAVIVNPKDEKECRTPVFQNKIARAVAKLAEIIVKD